MLLGDCCPTMDLLRSEPMHLVQLIMPVESAHRTISYLGDLGLFQFKDLNAEKSPFQRTYATQLKQCGEMARKLRFFREQMTKAGFTPLSRFTFGTNVSLDELEEMPMEASKQVKLGYICGLIMREKSMAFERILFRTTRGNMFLRQVVVEDPVTDPTSGDKVDKNVFVIFYSGERAKSKILKICDAFGANRYPFTDDVGKQYQMIAEVSGKISELETTIDVGMRHRATLFHAIGSEFEQWNLLAKREKSIFHVLNMLSLDVTKKCLVGEGWCPVSATNKILRALQQAKMDSNSQVGAIYDVLETKESPPTYFKTNKFTSAFQEIVDAYGVAKYQEANPGVYTIVTFPFLFAVMFGDWGHGICLFLASLLLIFREKQLSKQKLGDIMGMAFGGRYVIVMMALFSIYSGLIYNEFFSVPFELFGRSAYRCQDSTCRDVSTSGLVKVHSTYPFGVDPKWHGSRSELPFLNSLKMKMSILIGVAQMNLGIVLSYFNAKFFGNDLNVRYQFFPQLIFLNCLFGYLSLLIIVKWCTGSQADLYHVMIYMFLSPTDDLGENQLFVGQKFVQLLLLMLALIAVPWMLFPKPLLLKKRQEERHRGQFYEPLQRREDSFEMETHGSSNFHEEFQFSEIFVHQLIHTIEFVLGAVSNTASYLRLWALRYIFFRKDIHTTARIIVFIFGGWKQLFVSQRFHQRPK